jgi:hypothetical protein
MSGPTLLTLVYTLVTPVSVDEWFDWDEGNEDRVQAHGVEPGEVEEALLDPERIRAAARNVPGRGASRS